MSDDFKFQLGELVQYSWGPYNRTSDVEEDRLVCFAGIVIYRERILPSPLDPYKYNQYTILLFKNKITDIIFKDKRAIHRFEQNIRSLI